MSEYVCSVCGDVITPGTMNASGVEVRESGIVCGVCVDVTRNHSASEGARWRSADGIVWTVERARTR